MTYSNDRLLEALSELLLKPSAAQGLSAADLLSGMLLLPTPEPANRLEKLMRTNLTRAVSVDLHMNFDGQGRKLLSAFTDEQAMLRAFEPPCYYVAIKASDIYDFATANSVETLVINPAGPCGIVLQRCDIDALSIVSRRGCSDQSLGMLYPAILVG